MVFILITPQENIHSILLNTLHTQYTCINNNVIVGTYYNFSVINIIMFNFLYIKL